MSNYSFFRTSPTIHRVTHFETVGNVDRDNRRLFGVIGMETGEALGHGVWADEITLEMVADLGNEKTALRKKKKKDQRRMGNEPKGIRQRFGHPGMSESATGKQLGIAENFRVVDGRLLHDTRFFEFASLSPIFTQDPVEYIMTAAETDPEFVNESAVLDADLVWVFENGDEQELTDEEAFDAHFGEAIPPEGASYELPVLRPNDIHFFDFVNEGALTNSLLPPDIEAQMFEQAFSGHSSEFSNQLWQALDEFVDRYSIPLEELPVKANQLLSKYVNARTRRQKGDSQMAKRRKEKPATVEVPGAITGTGRDGLNVSQLAFEGEGGVVQTVEPVNDNAVVETDVTVTEPQAVVEPEPVIDESGQVASQTVDDEDDELDDPLAEAEEVTSQVETEPTNPQATPELSAILSTLTSLSTQINQLSEQVTRQSNLLVLHSKQIKAISDNVQRIDGERVVSASVPKTVTPQPDRLQPLPQGDPNTQQPAFVPPLHGFDAENGAGPTVDQAFSLIDGDEGSLVFATDTPKTAAQKSAETRVSRNQNYRMGVRS